MPKIKLNKMNSNSCRLPDSGCITEASLSCRSSSGAKAPNSSRSERSALCNAAIDRISSGNCCKMNIFRLILSTFIFASQSLLSASEENPPRSNEISKKQNRECDSLSHKKSKMKSRSRELFERLHTIPFEEQLEIKKLFHYLFKEEVFSFSIYGDKPLSFSESLDQYSANELLTFISLKDYYQDVFENFIEPSSILRKRWEIWEKYKDRFCLKKYLLLRKKIDKNEVIFLLNKKLFEKTVNQHIDLFKKTIKKEITAQQLFIEFADENTKVFDILQKNEGLLGILLGFGSHNSMLFQKRENLESQLKIMNKFGIYKPVSIERKIDIINSKLQPLREHDFNIISSVNQIRFVADQTNPETNKLKKKYDRSKVKIDKILYRDDWFEQLLIQLTSD